MSIVGELSLNVSEEWMARSLCKPENADRWYPEEDNGHDARMVCVDCPVRVECLNYAFDHNEQHGIWGGIAPKQRARMKRGEDPIYLDPRRCRRCNSSFQPRHGLNVYCSQRCRKYSESDRIRARKSSRA